MPRRILVGAAMLAAVLGAWAFDRSRPAEPAWALAALAALVMLGSLEELVRFSGMGKLAAWVARLLGAGWLLAQVLGGLDLVHLLAAVSAVAMLMAVALLRAGPGPRAAAIARRPLFAAAWVGGFACLVHPLLAGGTELVVTSVLVAKSSDVAAYFVGSTLGRRKLAPRISPHKTVEGALAGVLVPAALGALLGPGPGAGALLGALAVIANLTNSLFKRSFDVKDSGRLFGASGGLLDLADSLLLVGPFLVAYTAAAR